MPIDIISYKSAGTSEVIKSLENDLKKWDKEEKTTQIYADRKGRLHTDKYHSRLPWNDFQDDQGIARLNISLMLKSAKIPDEKIEGLFESKHNNKVTVETLKSALDLLKGKKEEEKIENDSDLAYIQPGLDRECAKEGIKKGQYDIALIAKTGDKMELAKVILDPRYPDFDNVVDYLSEDAQYGNKEPFQFLKLCKNHMLLNRNDKEKLYNSVKNIVEELVLSEVSTHGLKRDDNKEYKYENVNISNHDRNSLVSKFIDLQKSKQDQDENFDTKLIEFEDLLLGNNWEKLLVTELSVEDKLNAVVDEDTVSLEFSGMYGNVSNQVAIQHVANSEMAALIEKDFLGNMIFKEDMKEYNAELIDILKNMKTENKDIEPNRESKSRFYDEDTMGYFLTEY